MDRFSRPGTAEATSQTASAMPKHCSLMLLDKSFVEASLTFDAAENAVREAFILHSLRKGRGFPVIRERLADGSIFGIKSGMVEEQGLLGFKAAGFWPGNRRIPADAHQATVMLFDPGTGRPLCMVDGNAITTLRTGAAGGIAMRLLARPESRRLCVFGTGVQARIHTQFALRVLPTLNTIRYISIDGKPDPSFEAALGDHCDIAVAANVDDAVAQSDIVITATPGGGPLFDSTAVQPGTHLNCVGADTAGKRELPSGVLERSIVVVDDQEQASSLGECQWAASVTSVEIGAILDGQTQVQRTQDDITVFDMTGLALQDLTVARLLYRQALQAESGAQVAWPW